MGIRQTGRLVLLAGILAAGLMFSPMGPRAAALDTSAITDPLAAALMNKPFPLDPRKVQYFMIPYGRVSNFEDPMEVPMLDRFPTPGLVSQTSQLPVKVFQTVPVNHAIFPPNSVVTLGWLPADEAYYEQSAPTQAQVPIRYEIIITRHDNWDYRQFVKVLPTTRHYAYFFTPPTPGRYQWYIRAIYSRAMHGINSDRRFFTVLP